MNFSRWIGFIVLAIALYILWEIRQLLLLLFTAVVLANALNHLVRWFERHRIRRGYAIILSMSLLLMLLVGFFWAIVPAFAEQFQQLIQQVPRGINQLIANISRFISNLDPELIKALPTPEQLTQQLQPLLNQIGNRGLSVFYSTLGIPLTLLLVLVLTLMLLVNPQPYRKGFIRLFPSFYRHRIDDILTQCNEALQGWLLGVLFNMTVIATLSFIGLLILQIPLALAQAMLAGLLTFIPNIGPALSVVPPMAIALLETPWKAVAVLILYIGIQQLETHLLTPMVMARQVSLLPAITLLSQLFFATFFGFFGLFLALPLTVVAQVWLKEVLIKDILDQWQENEDLG